MDIGATFEALVPILVDSTGNICTHEEHWIALLAIHLLFKIRINMSILSDNPPIGPINISWCRIEDEVSRDFHLKQEYVIDLRKIFLDSGEVMVVDSKPRGSAATGSKTSASTKFCVRMLS